MKDVDRVMRSQEDGCSAGTWITLCSGGRRGLVLLLWEGGGALFGVKGGECDFLRLCGRNGMVSVSDPMGGEEGVDGWVDV